MCQVVGWSSTPT
jgi:hypothetical protein